MRHTEFKTEIYREDEAGERTIHVTGEWTDDGYDRTVMEIVYSSTELTEAEADEATMALEQVAEDERA